jgi:hypothetical protein
VGRETAPFSWLPSRHPRSRRTLAGPAGGAGGIGGWRRKDCRFTHQMESALGARKKDSCTRQPHHLGARLDRWSQRGKSRRGPVVIPLTLGGWDAAGPRSASARSLFACPPSVRLPPCSRWRSSVAKRPRT